MSKSTNTVAEKKKSLKESITRVGDHDRQRDAVPSLKVPTLPGFMSKMLVSPSEGEKDIVFINVRFFKESYELVYGIRMESGAVETLTGGQYSDHKAAKEKKIKETLEAKALLGLRAKLATRLMIVSELDDVALKVAMATPFTSLFKDLMNKSQKDFDELYPSSKDVCLFWDLRSPDIKQAAVDLASRFGDPAWTNRIELEKKLFADRELKKVMKAKAFKEKKELSSDKAKPLPIVSWADEEEEEDSKKESKKPLQPAPDEAELKSLAECKTVLDDPGSSIKKKKKAQDWTDTFKKKYPSYFSEGKGLLKG